MTQQKLIVGVTGTQRGMDAGQLQRLSTFLASRVDHITALHHGDCIGVDEQAHHIARNLGIYIVGHPPINSRKRAFCECDELCEPEEYLDRNHTIVDECDILLVIPLTNMETLRSGTWATKRYAMNQDVRTLILGRS